MQIPFWLDGNAFRCEPCVRGLCCRHDAACGCAFGQHSQLSWHFPVAILLPCQSSHCHCNRFLRLPWRAALRWRPDQLHPAASGNRRHPGVLLPFQAAQSGVQVGWAWGMEGEWEAGREQLQAGSSYRLLQRSTEAMFGSVPRMFCTLGCTCCLPPLTATAGSASAPTLLSPGTTRCARCCSGHLSRRTRPLSRP